MKKKIFPIAAISWLMLCISACQSSESISVCEKIPVEVNFSSFDINVNPDDNQTNATRASAKTANVNRLSLKIFDSETEEIALEKNLELDSTAQDFEKVFLLIYPGDYYFVAVAHKSGSSNLPAEITSPTEVTIPIKAILPTYTSVQQAQITESASSSVSIDFGYRVTSTFVLKYTDPTPDEVEVCEIIINPLSPSFESHILDPSTGLLSEKEKVAVKYTKPIIDGTFTNIDIPVNTYLSMAEETVDIQINMKSADGTILATRTLSSVTMKQHHTTRATGRFFSDAAFTFADETANQDISVSF